MGRRLRLIVTVIAVAGCWTENAFGQSAQPAESQIGVVLVKLSAPVYPPLARQASISGDVEVKLTIRQDGTIVSAEVLTGHGMLKQAALESAQKSRFECRRCTTPIDYRLTYSFVVKKFDPEICKHAPKVPEVVFYRNHVTISADALCVETDTGPPEQTPSQNQQGEVALIRLSPPIYPPLARQALVMSDVQLQVQIRPDGTLDSAEVISGHPMLKQAALESAQKSQFICRAVQMLSPYLWNMTSSSQVTSKTIRTLVAVPVPPMPKNTLSLASRSRLIA